MNALTIAKYVITKCYNDKHPITNLKLQKMLYFLFGYYYTKYNDYLFDDKFVAWKLGPVVLDVYFEFNSNISNPICEIFDVELNLPNDRHNFIDKKINELQKKSTWDLVEDSHKTEPWIITYDQGKGKGKTIENYEIEDYFEKVSS